MRLNNFPRRMTSFPFCFVLGKCSLFEVLPAKRLSSLFERSPLIQSCAHCLLKHLCNAGSISFLVFTCRDFLFFIFALIFFYICLCSFKMSHSKKTTICCFHLQVICWKLSVFLHIVQGHAQLG